MHESKFNKVTRNLSFHLGYEIVIVFLGFIIPRLVISVYGSEVNGLTSTMTQTVQLVSLLQAGIATATIYLLYKPVNEYNKTEIAKILASVEKTFRRIGFIVLALGLIVSLFLAHSIKSELSVLSIYIACILFFVKTSIDIILTQVLRVFLTATQNNYLLSISYTIEHVAYYSLTILIALLQLHFTLMYASLLLGCVLKICFLKFAFKKRYEPYRITLPKNSVLPKIKGMQYATYNEVAHSVVVASIPIIITIYCGLIKTSIYAIYLMIFNVLVVFSKSIYSSFSSSYGSVTATGDVERISRVFEIFQYSFFALTTWMYMCASILMFPFITIYTKGFTDGNYINVLLKIFIIIFGCFYSYRIPYNLTVSANGLFKETYLQPVITAVSTLVLSITITRYNFVYALVGPIIFYAVNTFYQYYKISKLKSRLNFNHLWNHLAVSMLCVGGALLFAIFVGLKTDSYLQWVLIALCVAGVCATIIVVASLLFDRKSFLISVKYFKEKLLGLAGVNIDGI
jgi:O-antigen/teichoic acid export membrane protein